MEATKRLLFQKGPGRKTAPTPGIRRRAQEVAEKPKGHPARPPRDQLWWEAATALGLEAQGGSGEMLPEPRWELGPRRRCSYCQGQDRNQRKERRNASFSPLPAFQSPTCVFIGPISAEARRTGSLAHRSAPAAHSRAGQGSADLWSEAQRRAGQWKVGPRKDGRLSQKNNGKHRFLNQV